MNTNKIINRPSEVAAMLGISISTLDRWTKNSEFPQKIKLSARAVGYVRSEIIEFIELKKTKSLKERA